MILRFIGTEAEVAGKALKTFGASIELSEAAAANAVLPDPACSRGVPLIPDADFAACGFTQQELARYAFGPARRAPDDPKQLADYEAFAAKWTKAREVLHNFRETLRTAPAVKDGE